MDEAAEAEGFNTFEEKDPEVLKLEEAVMALEDELAVVRGELATARRNIAWGFVRAGNAYSKPPLVKPKTEALGPETGTHAEQ